MINTNYVLSFFLSEIIQENMTFKTIVPSFCIFSILMAEYTLFRSLKSPFESMETHSVNVEKGPFYKRRECLFSPSIRGHGLFD